MDLKYLASRFLSDYENPYIWALRLALFVTLVPFAGLLILGGFFFVIFGASASALATFLVWFLFMFSVWYGLIDIQTHRPGGGEPSKIRDSDT
ncbi:MAG: hypothetical protein ACFFFG_00665 [Candidatus Thorarchaeota archaeon]